MEEGALPEAEEERRNMSMQWCQLILQPSQWQLGMVSMSTSHETITSTCRDRDDFVTVGT